MSQQEMPEAPLNERVEELLAIIQETYLSDGRPWIIGFSGGKDSTCILQLVWTALCRLPKEQRTKVIHCISSDTLVEMPIIADYLQRKIRQLNQAAALQDLPIRATTVMPAIDETFWVNMIGRGYPAPYRNFRWCTDRMKIKPTTRYIKERIAEHGEVIIVLGVRKAESTTRAAGMREQHVNKQGKRVGRRMMGQYLSQHKDLTSAFIFSPIEDWSTEDVWEFLRGGEAPWGDSHQELETLYRDAQKPDDDGEDELAEQTFGNSRFGCWTCTVVQRDLTMEAYVQKGEEWLKPLLRFRDDLMLTFEREFKIQHREHRRRSGRIQTSRDKDGNERLIWGPFTLSYRKEMLRRLLEAQEEIRRLKRDPQIELILRDELLRIRQLWRTEEADWEDAVPKIVEEVTGVPFEVPRDDWSGMGDGELRLLAEVCSEHALPLSMVTDLFQLEKSYHGMSRRSRVFDKINTVFMKDWRSREEVFAEIGLERSLGPSEIGYTLYEAEKTDS